MAVGQVDQSLCSEIKSMISRVEAEKEGIKEGWVAVNKGISDEMFYRYSGELSGVLCSLTGGEAKNMLKAMSDIGELEGFKALAILSQRFDTQTPASLLQAFLEVVSPQSLKGNEVVAGINRWETKVSQLRGRHQEEIGGKIRISILIGMLPKEYQEMVLQNGITMREDFKYQGVRDFVLNVANQKLQLSRPTPMELWSARGR